jgi:hypothetical protein
MAQFINANIGDTVWIHGVKTDEDNPLCKAKVEHVFHLYGMPQYVVSVETPIDPVLYVRNGFSISDNVDLPIGLWRRNGVDDQ